MCCRNEKQGCQKPENLKDILFTTVRGFGRTETYDGPICLQQLHQVAENQPVNSKNLVMMNQTNRRFVFAAAFQLSRQMDLLVYPEEMPPANIKQILEGKNDSVILVPSENSQHTRQELSLPKEYLLQDKRICENRNCRFEILVYRRQSATFQN